MASGNKPTALVTGGSRGIGAGIVRHLLDEGYDVAVNGRRDTADVQDAMKALAGPEYRVTYCRADISVDADRVSLVDQVRNHFGRLDLLVNNAGITSPGRKDILEADLDSFDTVLATNLRGPFFLTQLAARWMIQQRQADPARRLSIVNISSISAEMASTNRGDYCMAKAGLGMATRLWAVRLAEFDIPVYEIRPGIITSDMTTPVKEKYDKLIAEGLTLEPRWGTPSDIGRAVAMLARGDLPYATGQVLTMDGGLTMPWL